MRNTQNTILNKLFGWSRIDEVKKGRWIKAQEYERRHWERIAHDIVSGSLEQLDWYAWKARQMEKQLGGHLDQEKKKSMRILEVGSGPIGIVSFLGYGNRYAVDPLEDFYRINSVLCELRDREVSYIKGNGEYLPFGDNFFHLVILDNVLDHVHNTTQVLKEIYRVLSNEGRLYLAVNVHTIWGGLLHFLLGKMKIDKGHPHTFTVEGVKDFIHKSGFSIVSEFVSDYRHSRRQNRKSASLKDRLKGYSGLSEFIYSAVCSKEKRMECDSPCNLDKR